MSEAMEDLLHYLESLGTEGRKALLVAGVLWQESWRSSEERAQKAEAQLQHVRRWAEDWNLGYDAERIERLWTRETARRSAPLLPWHEERIEQRKRELRELKRRLEEATRGERQATQRAERERARAEQAERECDHLMAEIEWMRRRSLGL